MHRRDRFVRRASLWIAACIAHLGCPAPGPCEPPSLDGDAAGPTRIVVIAPAAAEILEALGAADRIVGVGDFVSKPESLTGLPRVGAYDAPSLERIVELDTDLVVTSTAAASAPAAQRLETLGVEVLALDTDTYDGVLKAIEVLGVRLGLADVAAHRADAVRDGVEEVRRRAAHLAPRRVLCVVGRDPLFVAGPGSHLDVLISAAGGRNVAADLGLPYARMSLEVALERLPEVIVEVSDYRPGAPRGRDAGVWRAWDFLPAVQADRVYWVDPDLLAVPGMRMAEAARLLARMIHPEAFGAVTADDLVSWSSGRDASP